MGRNFPASVPCLVCGDRSYGKHYGVYCCDGCSCFFKRSVRRNILYTCISGDGRCIVDKARRNWCPYCRLQRCFAVNMNTAAVQEERGPRKPKIQNIQTLKLNRELSSHSKSSTSEINIQNSRIFTHFSMTNHEISAQIFLVTIKQARNNPYFRILNRDSQNKILAHIWAPLFMLKAAYWPLVEINDIIPAYKDTLQALKNLKLNDREIEVVENLLLCRNDLLLDDNQVTLAKVLQEKCLEGVLVRPGIDKRRLISVLIHIPLLFTMSTVTLQALLFSPVIGPIPIETVIATI